MSIAANERILADSMVKHILAWDARTEIHARPLELADEDNRVPRGIIYEAGSRQSADGSLLSELKS